MNDQNMHCEEGDEVVSLKLSHASEVPRPEESSDMGVKACK